MSEAEARDEISEVLRRYSGDLDGDDLRAIAEDLEATAEQWEGIQL